MSAGRKISLISNSYALNVDTSSVDALSVWSTDLLETVNSREERFKKVAKLLGDGSWLYDDAQGIIFGKREDVGTVAEGFQFLYPVRASDLINDVLGLSVARLSHGKSYRIIKASDGSKFSICQVSSSINILPMSMCVPAKMWMHKFIEKGEKIGDVSFLNRLNTFLKSTGGVVVETLHIPGRRMRYRVMSVSGQSARTWTFPFERDGVVTEISIFEYFRYQNEYKKWVVNLEEPDLGIILIDNKGRGLPLGVCFVVSTSTSPKTSLSQTFCARKYIQNSALPLLLKIGSVELSSKPEIFKGKLLPDVSLEYRSKSIMTAIGGSWVLTGQKLLEAPSGLVKLGVININGDHPTNITPSVWLSTLSNEAKKHGVSIHPEAINQIDLTESSTESLKRAFTELVKVTPLIIVFIPRKNLKIYSAVKTVGEVSFGVPTQVVVLSNPALSETGFSYWHSMIIKISGKLPALSNSPVVKRAACIAVVPSLKKLMVVGIAKCRLKNRSDQLDLLSMVASLDKGYSVFGSELRAQKAKDTSFVEMLVRLLERFFLLNRELPEDILFLRYSSESPLAFIKDKESINAAMKIVSDQAGKGIGKFSMRTVEQASEYLRYSPRICFVEVDRHHSQRFWCEKPADLDKKSGSIPSGCLIESSQNSFYLFPHSGIVGTSRPTLFKVLLDEIFTDQSIHQFINALCYCGVRGTKSISIPGVLSAAQTLCNRGKVYAASETDIGASAEYFNERFLLRETLQERLQGLNFFM